MSNERPPSRLTGSMRPRSASQVQFEEMQRRVGRRLGVFGERDGLDEDRDPLADNQLKPTLQLMGALFAVSVVMTYGLGTDSKAVNIIAAIVAAGLLWSALTRPPVHVSARIFLATALFLEAATDLPTFWRPPLKFVDMAFYASLKDFAGVPGLSLPLFFFGAAGLLYRARKVSRARDPDEVAPPSKAAVRGMVAFLIAVIALEAWGLARGGLVQQSFFQIIHLVTMPIVGLAFLHAFRGSKDLPAIGTIIVTVAVARSLLCVGVYFTLARTFHDAEGYFTTTHADTVLFATALFILLAYAIEHRSRKVVLRCLGLALVVLGGVALNNRRLAFVSLGAAPVMMYLSLKPSPTKRRVTRAAFFGVALILAYVILGSQASGDNPLWKPAKLAMSVLDQKDSSSEARDIENYNLIYTMSQNPVLGTGFGWEYSEKLKLYDISELFALYRYIAHNGVLWIWSVGGFLGFTALWFIYPLSMTFGIRGYRQALTPIERTGALTSIGIVVACMAQIWGDQGWNSYLTLVMFSVGYAIAAQLEAAPLEP